MRDQVEAAVLRILSDVLETTPRELAERPELVEHGWDSMALLEAFVQLESRFGGTLDFLACQQARTVADLVNAVTLAARVSGRRVDDGGADPGARLAEVRRRWKERSGKERAEEGGRRVALLATFTVDPLTPYLGTALAEAGTPAQVWAGPFNQIERQCLEDDSPTAHFRPRTLVVAPRLEELWSGLPEPGAHPPEAYETDVLYLAGACLRAARRWRAELIFVLPAVPEERPAGDDGNPRGVAATAARVRQALRDRLAAHQGVLVLDAEGLVRNLGSAHVYRPELLAGARVPFSEEYFDLLGRRLAQLVGTADEVRAEEGDTPTLRGFLDSLRLEVDCRPLKPEAAEEAADLTRRVSEFHLNGRTWSAERITELVESGTHTCWEVIVRDRFGDHGVSGVVLARPEGESLLVEAWVLTCPVLGKGVEDRVLERLRELAGERGRETLAFAYRGGKRNDAAHRFLSGLVSVDREADTTLRIPATDPMTSTASRKDTARRQAPMAGLGRRRPKRSTADAALGHFASAADIVRAIESREGTPAPATDSHGGPAEPKGDTAWEVLAELFAEVLRVDSIPPDQGFFDAGGNSMLALQLIAKANKAGLRITLQQVFKHQTAAALATAAVPMAAPADAQDIGGPAPLLPLQAWFFGLDLANPNHFNQSLRFEMPYDVDPIALRRAVAALVGHHPATRMRFTATPAGHRQIDDGPPAQPPFIHLDLSDTDPATWDASVTEHENGLQLGMDPSRGRLVAFALYTFGPSRPPRLLVIFHHLAVDGISWRLVFEDLQEAYLQAVKGGAVRLRPAGMSPPAYARRLNAYAQSPKALAELPRWLDERRRKVEPIPVDLPDGDARGPFTHGETTVFTPEQTRVLRDRAVNLDHVPVDRLLLAGATRALARWTGRDLFMVDVVNHGREPFLEGVDVSRTVAWLVMNVPVLLEVDGARAVRDLVPEVDRQLRDWSSADGGGDQLLRFLSQDESVRRRLAELPSSEVEFSYGGSHPGYEDNPVLGRYLEVESHDMDPRAAIPHALQFDTMIFGDQLQLEVRYRATRYRAATMRTLLRDWADGLRELAGRS
ncbi:condensation domain-containing protein [Streptosporangium sp. CA-135522]|uniref:condensation domain-containing protein n=1 Tax=Streptosporangium sp. CA-135522 TaxID=3240072 RepID=UPI003D8E16C8